MKFWCLLVFSDAVVLVSSELYRSDGRQQQTHGSWWWWWACGSRICYISPTLLCRFTKESCFLTAAAVCTCAAACLSQTGISYWSDQRICELKRNQSVIEKQSRFQAPSLLTCFCPANPIIKMRKWWVCRKHPYIALQFYSPVLK